MTASTIPPLFTVTRIEDLDRIPFRNGMATVEIPAILLDQLELKNHKRADSPRLRALETSIRAKGFRPLEPITARVGRKGRWVILNGGHRLTAARNVMREFWSNLFRRKVGNLYFVLFTNADSWTKTGRPRSVSHRDMTASGEHASRDNWERAEQRMRIGDTAP